VNLASIIDGHEADDVALISRTRPTTYGELRAQVGGLRGGLIELGLEPGDRVGIVCANNWYFVAAYLAVLGVGAVAVPLNPLSPAHELERELATVSARAVIVGPSGHRWLGELDRSAVPSLDLLVASEGEHGDGVVTLDDLAAHEPAPIVAREPGDLAVLVFTSGTAGRPKAAMLSHGNLLANIAQVNGTEERRQTAADVSFGVLPLFHIFGLTVVLGCTLEAGGTVALVERFDPASALETIDRYRVTVVAGAPGMWGAWASLPDAPADALRTVRLATSGSDRLPADVATRILERYGVTIHEGYGLTEASPVVTSSIGQEPHFGSVGLPLEGVRIRLVDGDGADALVGDSGEIWVQGDNVFQGYWDDPEATAAVLTPDGWLRTGDVAVVDDEGYLELVDRAKDLIIVSGFNVYPAEVEDVLIEHPGVEACAVVGVPHPYSGQAVKAFVVVAPGRSYEEDEIIAWCADHLARYKCPEKVMFVDELPHGLSGKVLRRELT
jgi:long-chain acyl-CoA synthetase